MQLILASASPRRQELLKLFGVPFTVKVADIDETMDPAASPFDEVARVSRLKHWPFPGNRAIWSLPQIPSWYAAAGCWASPIPLQKQRKCCICSPAGTIR